MKPRAIKKARHTPGVEYGLNLDVLGSALIAQADERIKWHERTAAVMATELRPLTSGQGAPEDVSDVSDVKSRIRRTDLERKMYWHLEYARFLTFVRENIVGDRLYKLGFADLSALEITPRETY